MKANEFVKIFGWGKAKEVSSFTSNVCEDPTHFDSDLDIYVHFDDFKGVMDESDVCIHDIKQLVESYDLIIKDFESIEMAEYEYMVSASHSDPYWVRVKQAIADVESCL